MRPSFPITRLDYALPNDLIAQVPVPQRDASRLLLVDRGQDAPADRTFHQLPDQLAPGDLLVLNDTRVIPARFLVQRATGGLLEGLFLRETESATWEVLLRGAGRLKPGERLTFQPDTAQATMCLEERMEGGRWRVRLDVQLTTVDLLDRVGQAPLPPYIHRPKLPPPEERASDRQRYQTVYAERPGAVAAPTAGLHFTPELLETLTKRDVAVARVTLHVGVGTFAPIAVDDLRDHRMHAEWYDLPADTAAAVQRCRQRGGRVIAVGTTSLRVLETCATAGRQVRPAQGWTELFCYPPYRFSLVDALLTNFHLPRSTLLALVMAFAGTERIRRAYRHAIEQRYRFFSYGDAMLIA
ncbi:MAG: tRNA preQ1(34) S-adenosylmethionine ribosyltransferase-isomerase QueA [Planctomycetes bacterium]|nr:tRNA preQ1(34) S-adenosylmethionine ribosyltransferase-isomerase QueA [Planctomycetota bacterium]